MIRHFILHNSTAEEKKPNNWSAIYLHESIQCKVKQGCVHNFDPFGLTNRISTHHAMLQEDHESL